MATNEEVWKCKVCKKPIGLNSSRLGVCWFCAEAESIIEEGLDMSNKSLSKDNTPAVSAMDKVRLLIDRGCIIVRR